MKVVSCLWVFILLIAPTVLAQDLGSTSSPGKITLTQPTTSSSEDVAQQKLLQEAMAMIRAGNPEGAINGPDAKVLEYFQQRYGNDGKRYFAARTEAETLLYLADAAKQHQTAIVLPPTWARAWFIKGSALNGLGRYHDAIDALEKARALSPWNAMYLTELGYSYEMTHDADKALALCERAVTAAEFSPRPSKSPSRPVPCAAKVTTSRTCTGMTTRPSSTRPP